MKLKSSDIRTEISQLLDQPVYKAVQDAAQELNQEVYLVGGYVRDFLLNKPSQDLDFVTLGSGINLAQKAAQKLGVKTVSVFKTFGTAHFRSGVLDLEFVGARKESYRSDSRKPTVEDGSLQDDQNRRDFTINAMAISLNPSSFGEILDPFNGRLDLKKKIIRTPLEPETTFSDDPLRMMRAIRFASQLDFIIEAKTIDAITNMNDRIAIISQERITDELNKIILSPVPSVGFKLLHKTGLLERLFPEMIALKGTESRNGISHKDNFYHTLEVLDNVSSMSDNLYLRWSAILHDIAKPATKRFSSKSGWTFHGHEDKGAKMVPKIFRRMKLPMDHHLKFVQKMVALHLRPIALTKEQATDSAVRRLLFDAGDDIDLLMQLCRADITSKNEAKVEQYLRNYEKVKEKLLEVEENDRVRNWQPPISGEIIMKTFDLKPSREVGIIKQAIREAILDGEIHNDYQEAYSFMLKKGSVMGLKAKN